jgi:hypothetical protein
MERRCAPQRLWVKMKKANVPMTDLCLLFRDVKASNGSIQTSQTKRIIHQMKTLKDKTYLLLWTIQVMECSATFA